MEQLLEMEYMTRPSWDPCGANRAAHRLHPYVYLRWAFRSYVASYDDMHSGGQFRPCSASDGYVAQKRTNIAVTDEKAWTCCLVLKYTRGSFRRRKIQHSRGSVYVCP